MYQNDTLPYVGGGISCCRTAILAVVRLKMRRCGWRFVGYKGRPACNYLVLGIVLRKIVTRSKASFTNFADRFAYAAQNECAEFISVHMYTLTFFEKFPRKLEISRRGVVTTSWQYDNIVAG